MNKHKFILKTALLSIAIALLLGTAGCSGGGGGSSSSTAATTAGGGGAKGPFKEGSLVVAYELTNGVRDRNITTATTDSRGHFNFGSTIPWTGPTEFVISGEYLNENTGTYMVLAADKGLSAVTNIASGTAESVNINILTNIAAPAIKADLVNGASIASAKADAQADVAEMFNLNLASGAELTDLDLTQGSGVNAEANTQLLVISSALLSTDNPELVMQNLADGLEDGEADSTALMALEEIQTQAANVDLQEVAANMEDADIGVTDAPDSESVLNGTLSFDHNISFANEQDAFRSTVYTSAEATVVGMIGESGPISVTNGSYSIDGGDFVTTAGTVANGQKVRVKATSSAEYATAVQAKLNIGGADILYSVTTKSDPFVADTTPNAFSFGFKAGQAVNTTNVTSDAVTITGINTPTAVTISGGSTFDVNSSGTFVASANITNGSAIRVRNTASGSAGTEVKSTVTIGGVEGTFSSFTVPEDTTPDVFTFTDVNDVNKTATPAIDSNQITISGINTATPISVVGGEMNVAGAGFTTIATTIDDGQTIILKAVPSNDYETTTAVTVTVGNVVSSFNVTTMSDPVVDDTTPNAFSFATKLNQAVNTGVDANITVSGINIDTPISITNGIYSVNGGGQDANVSNGDVVTITQTTSSEFDTENVTTLTVGGVSATFKTRTLLEDTTPDDVNFDSNLSVTTSAEVTSNSVTITGINTDIPISIENGTYSIGGAFTAVDGTVSDGDTLTIRQTSASTQGTSNVTTVTIGSMIRSFTTKTQINAPAISGTASATVAEDSEYSFSPTIDANSGEITTWSITNKPTWAEFNTLNGLLSGIPQNADVATTNDINITATNAQGSSSIVIALLEVTNTNDAPIANNDSGATNEETDTSVDVVANDTDVDVGDTFSVTAVTNGAHGLATFLDGNVTYTPTTDFVGSDVVTYTLSDASGATATATLTIAVANVNDAPLAGTFTPLTTIAQDAAYSFTAVATDADANATLTYSLNNNPSWMSIDGSSGVVSGTPSNADVNTTNGVQVLVTDGIIGSPVVIATFNVEVTNVNDPATIGGTTTGNVTEDGSLVATGTLSVTDIDVGEAELVAQASVVKTYGTFDVNASGDWTYTLTNSAQNVQALADDVNVTDTIDVTSKDGTDTKTITVTITGTNDVAVFGGDIAGAIAEDTASTSGTISVDDNDTAQGEVQLITDANATYGVFNVATSGAWTYALTDTPTIQALKLGQTLSDGTVVTSKDGSATQDLNITITGTNDAPEIVSIGAQSIKKITDLNITLSATDVDNDHVLSLTDASSAGATVNFDANGSVTFNAPTAGDYTLNYTFSDEHNATANGSLSVTVTNSDAPVAINDTATIQEDTNSTISVLTNDSDDFTVDENLTIAIELSPADGTVNIEADNTITYSPALNYNGTDSFTYRVTDVDGGFDTADVNITINAVNDAPVAGNDTNTTAEDTNVTINVLANDSDVDGDDYNVTAVTQATNGSVTFTPDSVTYSPDADFSGNDSFMYTISDGNGGEDNATVSITVTPVNDAPVITTSGNIVVVEDSNVTIVDINITDVDGTLDPANVSMFSDDNSTATVIDGNATTVSVMAQANQNGAVNITIRAVDGNLTTEETFMFTITAVNDAPIANDDNVSALMNDTTPESWYILNNDIDIDDNNTNVNLTIASCDANSTHGTFTWNSNEITSYTPDGNYTGYDSFECTITDGDLNATSIVHVNVSGNHRPVIVNDSLTLTMLVNSTLNIPVIAYDDDNDTLAYSTDTGSIDQNGSLTVNSGASATVVNIGIEVSDGNLSATTTYTVNVIESQAQVDPYEISGDSLTQGEFDAIGGLAIPSNTKLHGLWGSQTDENNVTTINSDYLEFLTTGELIVSDDNETDYGHDGETTSYGLNGMVSASAGSTTYNSASKMVEAKLEAVYEGSAIGSNIPSLANFPMPSNAKVYKMAFKMLQEKYELEGEAEDWSSGSRQTYDTLSLMVENDAHGIVDYNRDNHNRIIVFADDQNLSDGNGIVIEVDTTDGNIAVVNANAGIWATGTYSDDDNNSIDMVKVTLSDSVSGYNEDDIILVEFGAVVNGSTTTTVYKGQYREAGAISYDYRLDDVAMSVINAANFNLSTYIVGNQKWFVKEDGMIGERTYSDVDNTYSGTVKGFAVSGTYDINGSVLTLNRTDFNATTVNSILVFTHVGPTDVGDGEMFMVSFDGTLPAETYMYDTETERDQAMVDATAQLKDFFSGSDTYYINDQNATGDRDFSVTSDAIPPYTGTYTGNVNNSDVNGTYSIFGEMMMLTRANGIVLEFKLDGNTSDGNGLLFRLNVYVDVNTTNTYMTAIYTDASVAAGGGSPGGGLAYRDATATPPESFSLINFVHGNTLYEVVNIDGTKNDFYFGAGSDNNGTLNGLDSEGPWNDNGIYRVVGDIIYVSSNDGNESFTYVGEAENNGREFSNGMILYADMVDRDKEFLVQYFVNKTVYTISECETNAGVYYGSSMTYASGVTVYAGGAGGNDEFGDYGIVAGNNDHSYVIVDDEFRVTDDNNDVFTITNTQIPLVAPNNGTNFIVNGSPDNILYRTETSRNAELTNFNTLVGGGCN